uniref:Nonribosomal peptide synthetase 1 n=1 Tax=Cochliobolus lunatus TaxID=5503 RepID=A0A1W6BS39_COCLU|nr:nonribosomal peptide synthetase 1 [Curvularia lunata]
MGEIKEEPPSINAQDLEKIWAANKKIFPAAVNRCVHQLFVEQAKARPSAPALCAWDGDMTYGELDKQSTRLASYLVSLGVRAEVMVPLCFEKSMWTVVAMLAVLKAGGAFVPLDPDHPASRHEEIFKQTEAKVVLTSVQHATLWSDSARRVVSVGETFVSQLSSVRDMDEATVHPSNAAYVMFTSGSTGIPKGVVLEHHAVSTSCLNHGKAIGVRPDTRALQFATYTFDACIAEIITPLVHGSCICIPFEDDRHNALLEVINTMNVNWAQLTPTVARLLDPQKTPSIKTLVLGGERVNSIDWERWGDGVEQINAYGPTECAVWCTSHTNSSAEGYKPGIIGRPIASVSWVVDPDDHNKLAPLGAIGELLVEGPIQARGYLKDAVKTEAAFINNPPWLVTGSEGYAGRRGRLYKTGDLVYYDADGNLVYVGRKDSQVKVRGQRVELSEIEYQLHECMPEVKRMAVEVISPAGDKDKAMVAVFLELNEEARGIQLVSTSSESNSTVRLVYAEDTDVELAQRLPSYMVPQVYFAIAQLPTTTSTKIDRRQLREIGASFSAQQLAEMRTRSQGPKRAPETQAERTMQQLWAQVLGIEASRIGLDDSFFRLGGDSITAMKLVAMAREKEIGLTVANIFQYPKLADLAALATQSAPILSGDIAPFSLLGPSIDAEQVRKEAAAVCGIDPSLIEDIYPCSPLQEGMLSLTQKRAGDYTMQCVLELRVDVDEDAFRAAWEEVAQSLPILRTRILQHSSRLVYAEDTDVELAQRLPSYMVPQVYFAIAQLPTTTSTKIDRRQLREIGASFSAQQLAEMRTRSQGPKRAPETQAERTMQQLWAQVLGIEASRIGLDDSFFRLGGDSITAMKLVAMAREKEIGLTVANIFQYPKLADLAALATQSAPILSGDIAPFSLLGPSIDAEQVRKEAAAVCGIDPSLIEDIYPCSPLQEGMLSLTQKRAGDYTMQCVLELRVDVDEDAFRAAWEEVAQSLPILRTRILQHSSRLVYAEDTDVELAQRLPSYMVPQVYFAIAQLPTTTSTKIDRRQLREIGASFSAQQLAEMRTRSQGPKRAPETQAERTMQQLWAQVLGIEASRIGLDDSFFRLGGDSITAMKLVAMAREKEIGLTVANIFQYPKLADLAALATQSAPILSGDIAPFSLLGPSIDAEQVRKEAAAVCGIDPSLIEDIYPCSPLQEGMLSLTQKRAGDYTMQCVLELRVDVDEDAFRAAWEEVAQSLPILRTRILQHSSRLVYAEDTDVELAQRLPSYMVPQVYFAIAQLPTTTSTKIDRRQLREIGASFSAQQLAEMRTRSQGPKRAPETQAERTMQQLWAQVLGIEASRIGLDDSFFRLGGDSITAMKLVAMAREKEIGLTVRRHVCSTELSERQSSQRIWAD